VADQQAKSSDEHGKHRRHIPDSQGTLTCLSPARMPSTSCRLVRCCTTAHRPELILHACTIPIPTQPCSRSRRSTGGPSQKRLRTVCTHSLRRRPRQACNSLRPSTSCGRSLKRMPRQTSHRDQHTGNITGCLSHNRVDKEWPIRGRRRYN
jgi:hypothetical protein